MKCNEAAAVATASSTSATIRYAHPRAAPVTQGPSHLAATTTLPLARISHHVMPFCEKGALSDAAGRQDGLGALLQPFR